MHKLAKHITTVTLVGYSHNGRPPWPDGNCFSVKCEDGSDYRIVNFNYENIKYAIDWKFIEFPIRIRVLNDSVALFDDTRIPSHWYSSTYCKICCPKELLTEPQKLQIERDIESGIRIESGIIITTVNSKRPDWRTEGQKIDDEETL